MRLSTHTRRQLQRHALGGQLLTLAIGLMFGWLARNGGTGEAGPVHAAAATLAVVGMVLRDDAEV